MATNTDLVLQALGAMREGQPERAADVVSSDFVWHIPGTSSISGEVTGAAAWSEKLQRLVAAGLQPQVLAVLDGEQHVAVLQRNTADTGTATLDIQVVNLFTIEDGRVARLDTFFSDQPAAEAFWNAAVQPG